METENNFLNRREREILILCAENRNCRHLSNAEIAQRLGTSVINVKATIHRACVKLGVHSRGEAIVTALKKGELSLSDLLSIDEMALYFRSFGSGMLRRMADLLRQGLENGCSIEDCEQIDYMYRKQDSLLTKAERNVLIFVGYGLTNREIADRRCISPSSVRTFLYRAFAKLGACRRTDAILLALEQGEIEARDFFSPDEVIKMFAPLGVEYIEKVAQLMDQKSGYPRAEPVEVCTPG